MDAVTTAYRALDVQMKIVDAITNNLANAETTGFKREFERIRQTEDSMDVETQADLSPGNLVATGNELDVAIDGPGFFVLQTPAGLRYTRAGNFQLNAQGELVTKDGMQVLSTSGSPISASGGAIRVQDGGVVMVDGDEAATLKIVGFPSAAQLQQEGGSRFVWKGSEQEIQNVAEPQVRGGYLEHSNVNPVQEMVRLIAASRQFEAIQRDLRTISSDMNGKLIQEFGTL